MNRVFTKQSLNLAVLGLGIVALATLSACGKKKDDAKNPPIGVTPPLVPLGPDGQPLAQGSCVPLSQPVYFNSAQNSPIQYNGYSISAPQGSLIPGSGGVTQGLTMFGSSNGNSLEITLYNQYNGGANTGPGGSMLASGKFQMNPQWQNYIRSMTSYYSNTYNPGVEPCINSIQIQAYVNGGQLTNTWVGVTATMPGTQNQFGQIHWIGL